MRYRAAGIGPIGAQSVASAVDIGASQHVNGFRRQRRMMLSTEPVGSRQLCSTGILAHSSGIY